MLTHITAELGRAEISGNTVTVELGRCETPAPPVIETGRVFVLGKTPDDDLDIFINGELAARGSVETSGEYLSVKITEFTGAAIGGFEIGGAVPLNAKPRDLAAVFADGKPAAKGEVVVLDGRFAVRIAEVM